jgi:hypothetical protein
LDCPSPRARSRARAPLNFFKSPLMPPQPFKFKAMVVAWIYQATFQTSLGQTRHYVGHTTSLENREASHLFRKKPLWLREGLHNWRFRVLTRTPVRGPKGLVLCYEAWHAARVWSDGGLRKDDTRGGAWLLGQLSDQDLRQIRACVACSLPEEIAEIPYEIANGHLRAFLADARFSAGPASPQSLQPKSRSGSPGTRSGTPGGRGTRSGRSGRPGKSLSGAEKRRRAKMTGTKKLKHKYGPEYTTEIAVENSRAYLVRKAMKAMKAMKALGWEKRNKHQETNIKLGGEGHSTRHSVSPCRGAWRLRGLAGGPSSAPVVRIRRPSPSPYLSSVSAVRVRRPCAPSVSVVRRRRRIRRPYPPSVSVLRIRRPYPPSVSAVRL